MYIMYIYIYIYIHIHLYIHIYIYASRVNPVCVRPCLCDLIFVICCVRDLFLFPLAGGAQGARA